MSNRSIGPWIITGAICGVVVSLIGMWVIDYKPDTTQSDSIHICGTFETSEEKPGTSSKMDFEMIITEKGATIDPGPDDLITLRICK